MSTEAFEIAQAVLVSVGGGSLIIFALSSWLGKVWANRILETDRNRYAQDMESIRQSNKVITDALNIASSTHSESVKIYSELRCRAVTELWKEFLNLKKTIPLSISFLDLSPDGHKLTEEAKKSIEKDFSFEKQKSLMQFNSEELSPYLDERHLELFYLYRKAIFRMHFHYIEILSGNPESKGDWRYDELLVAHFKLVFHEKELTQMQTNKWTANFFLTFVEKHIINELRNAVTGEVSSKISLEQSMKNIDLVAKITALESSKKANKAIKSDT